jgi:predicted transcriptional regulator
MSEYTKLLKSLARLNSTMNEMSKAIGLDTLTPAEQETLLAVVEAGDGSSFADIMKVAADSPLTESTAYRCLRALVEKGLLRKTGSGRSARYVVLY